MQVIDPIDKLNKITEHWSPAIIAELNGQHVKIAKIKGEFIWHSHEHEDELFYILKGKLKIELRDKTLELKEGEMVVIPKGVEHKPVAEEECSILLFEPASTINTGNKKDELTKEKLKWL